MSYKKIYDDDMLEEISNNVNLLEYVGQYMDLEKRGDDYYAHCPLHIDKTPSLSINPEANKWYCFSCGRGGDIISYLIEYEGLRFDQAVEKAASLAGIDISMMCRSETIAFLKKLKKWQTKQDAPFEHQIIPYAEYEKFDKAVAQEWLDEGISLDVMRKFDVRIDDRQNRIVYPVCDINGNLINIKARTRFTNYKELRIPKYINYYPIGVMDYFQSLNLSLQSICNKNEVIIFESVKSVMKAYGWGFDNCVSAEKHTLTAEQIMLLAKLHVNIVFAYDTDISYFQQDVKRNIDRLKMITNVFIINDRHKLLGGSDTKNAPVDCGREIWEELYATKKKVA